MPAIYSIRPESHFVVINDNYVQQLIVNSLNCGKVKRRIFVDIIGGSGGGGGGKQQGRAPCNLSLPSISYTLVSWPHPVVDPVFPKSRRANNLQGGTGASLFLINIFLKAA